MDGKTTRVPGEAFQLGDPVCLLCSGRKYTPARGRVSANPLVAWVAFVLVTLGCHNKVP